MTRWIFLLIAAAGWQVAAAGQTAPAVAPLPADPLELVGQVPAVEISPKDAARILDRARNSYALRGARRGYDLKVSFTVNSGGQTEHDGMWEMEEIFDPKQGFRWSAKTSSYSITRISTKGASYSDDSSGYVPLRLHESRAALFDPIPPAQTVAHASLRIAAASFEGSQLDCVLISGPRRGAFPAAAGRRWDEGEECVDQQTGLLRVSSQVPGRYYAYDYSHSPRLAGRGLPSKVTVTEAGKVVTEISVDSLTELPSADPSLFVPSERMRSAGRAIAMAGAQKVSRVSGWSLLGGGPAAHIVCVFGLVTPDGQLVEAHSLQPSDPNSAAAVEAAKEMSFSQPPAERGAGPQQHFVFILEKFNSAQ